MQWFIDLFTNLKEFLLSLFASLAEVFKISVYWLFNLLMNIVDSLINVVMTLLSPIDISQYMTGFPSGAAWVLGQIGVPQALVMIVASLGIRLLLQLIPFTRLGS